MKKIGQAQRFQSIHVRLLELGRKIDTLRADVNNIKNKLGMTESPSDVAMQVANIIDVVEKEYELAPDSVYSRTRKREICEARQLSMFLTSHATILKGSAVAYRFGYTSIAHARKNISNLIETNKTFRESFIDICHKLNLTDELITKMTDYDNNRKSKS
ncbi:MAG: helix-turn-helix domain-containing protein [Candidatus Izemoplasmatales bacterium]|jgi:chromosomal replication initiation ATPase DnaA